MSKLPDDRGLIRFDARYLSGPTVRPVRPPRSISSRFYPQYGFTHLSWETVDHALLYRVYNSGPLDPDGHITISNMHNDWKPREGKYYYLQTVIGRMHSPLSQKITPVHLSSGEAPLADGTLLSPPELLEPKLLEYEVSRDIAAAEISWLPVQGAVAYDVYRSKMHPESRFRRIQENVGVATDEKLIRVTDRDFKKKYGSGGRLDSDKSKMFYEGIDYFYSVSAIDSHGKRSRRSPPAVLRLPAKTVSVRFKYMKTAPKGRTAEEIWKDEPVVSDFHPHHYAAIDEKNARMYVTSEDQQVYIFSTVTGHFIDHLGAGSGSTDWITDPKGIDVDSEGNVYVIDGRKHTIVVFSVDGNPIRNIAVDPAWGGSKELQLVDLAVDRESGDIYIGGLGAERIVVLNATGDLIRTIDQNGWIPGLRSPNISRILIDREGNLVVFEQGHSRGSGFAQRLYFYNKSGEKLYYWDLELRSRRYRHFNFQWVRGVTFDKENNLIMMDSTGQIVAFLPDGRYLYHLKPKGPRGTVACDSNNRLYVIHTWANRLQAVQLSEDVPVPQRDNPFAVAR